MRGKRPAAPSISKASWSHGWPGQSTAACLSKSLRCRRRRCSRPKTCDRSGWPKRRRSSRSSRSRLPRNRRDLPANSSRRNPRFRRNTRQRNIHRRNSRKIRSRPAERMRIKAMYERTNLAGKAPLSCNQNRQASRRSRPNRSIPSLLIWPNWRSENSRSPRASRVTCLRRRLQSQWKKRRTTRKGTSRFSSNENWDSP